MVISFLYEYAVSYQASSVSALAVLMLYRLILLLLFLYNDISDMKSWDSRKEDRMNIFISKIMKFFSLVFKECFFMTDGLIRSLNMLLLYHLSSHLRILYGGVLLGVTPFNLHAFMGKLLLCQTAAQVKTCYSAQR